MAVTMFVMRAFYSEVELTPINLAPYLVSGLLGLALVFLYLYALPSQRKDRFLTFFIPGMMLLVVLIKSGLSNLWLIDELMCLISFICGGQEISKPAEKSL
ncbi:hypothetical protein [Thalassotalea maritima]|uniref:hypothetical protein n=1 Tax=Thalassotalea maritima TaxID=3242416 RepID=UPI0035276C29